MLYKTSKEFLCFDKFGKIPWRRAWQPTSVFLPGESPWTEEPGGLQPMGSQSVGHGRGDLAHTARLVIGAVRFCFFGELFKTS